MPPSSRHGPMQGLAVGGAVLGALLLVFGLLFLLANQGVLPIRFDIWTVCSLGLIALGVLVLAATLWMRRWMRRGWRDWIGWDGSREF